LDGRQHDRLYADIFAFPLLSLPYNVLQDSDSDGSEDEPEFKKLKLPPPATYLSQFFSAYPKYTYDPSGPASQQFQELRNVYKFDRS
jgi:hypothetical protein